MLSGGANMADLRPACPEVRPLTNLQLKGKQAYGEQAVNARKVTEAVALVGALATAAVILYASRPGSSGSVLFVAGVLLWSLLPYLILSLAAKRAAPQGRWAVSLAILTCAITGITLCMYVAGIFVDPDAQAGLMFVFFPAYQNVLAGVLWVVSLLVTRRTAFRP